MNNNIDQQLIRKSQAIFDDLAKWNALFELHALTNTIQDYWLTIGTKGLWKYFDQGLPDSWVYKKWDCDWETRWYLKEFGFNSLAIGFGWHYEFHLHLIDPKSFDTNLIDKQLKTEKYAKLLKPFGVNPPAPNRSGSKAVESVGTFNFTFGSANDGNIPLRELAWYAGHRTDDFVEQAADKIKQFTHDPEMTHLLTELNAEARIERLNS